MKTPDKSGVFFFPTIHFCERNTMVMCFVLMCGIFFVNNR